MADDGTQELEALAQYKLEAQMPLLPCDQEHPCSREEMRFKKFVIPACYSWEDAWERRWELLDDLHVEMRECFKCEQTLAVFPLAFEEYGVGPTWHIAIFDLLTSFSDYLESLGKHEGRLDPSAEDDLAMLRKLVRAKPAH